MSAPPTTALQGLRAVDLAELVNTRQVSAIEVIDATLAHIAAADPDLRAFTDLWPDDARRRARDLDQALTEGHRLPLAGVPLGIKASEGLESVQVRRLIAAGCIPVGATSVPRGTTWQTWGHTDRGPTRNPWRADRTPGGSSAGSAAAVAAGLVPLATGNDGAGSLRIPAAWCGIVGIKLTNGLLPTRDRAGLNAPGPLAASVTDAAAYLDAVLGTNLRAHIDTPHPGRPLRAIWSSTLGYAGVDPINATIARTAADRLAAAGHLRWIDHDVTLEDPATAWIALRGSTPDPTGTAVRRRNDRCLAEAFAVADVVLTPTTPATAHGHHGPGETMNVSLTWAFNLSGHPAASVPAGFDPDGVPVGLQLVTRHNDEATLLLASATAQRLNARTSSFRSDFPHAATLTIDIIAAQPAMTDKGGP